MKKPLISILITTILLLTQITASADDLSEAKGIVNNSLLSLNNFINDPEMTGFQKHIQNAKGILIIPNFYKGGIGIGGSGGKGVLLRHHSSNKPHLSAIDLWSYPAYYTMGSFTLGIQLGFKKSEAALLFMTEKGMDALLSNKMQLGADASIATGPIGMGSQAATVDVLQYTRGKGLFGGLTVEGAVISPNSSMNSAYYGKSVSPLDILIKGSAINPQADSLRARLASLDDKPADIDGDGDGVPDTLDRCPGTPNGAKTDKDGCWAYHGVFFDFDQENIKPEFQLLFENAILVMNLNPGLTVEIQGHTDNVGTPEYNLELSQRRAQAVKDYLVEHNIDAMRMTVRGLGMFKPVASNDTEEGRAYNRRVYFKRTDQQ